MAIFKTSVIKYNGPQDALVWKYENPNSVFEEDEIPTLGRLIVDEFYEAILFANGNFIGKFPAGARHLNTQTVPGLTDVYKTFCGGNPFPCKVYFVNIVHQLELKWGTQGGITINDPIYDIFLHVGCCGTMAIKIIDSVKFLLKFVGNKDLFDNKDLISTFRGIISSNVKNYISKIMIQGKVSFFDMNAHIYDVGLIVKRALDVIFEDYGVQIQQFNIESIDVPADDYKEIQKAKSLSTSRRIQGYTWKEEQMYKILDDAASNTGSSSQMMGAGMGLGMGLGVGAPMGRAFGDVANNAFNSNSSAPGNNPQGTSAPPYQNDNGGENISVNSFFQQTSQPTTSTNSNEKTCINCHQQIPVDSMFCPKCGTKQSSVCPNCGNQVQPDAAFCYKCGTKL